MLEALTPILFYWMFVGFFVFHLVVTVVNISTGFDYLCHQESESAFFELGMIALSVAIWPLPLYYYYQYRMQCALAAKPTT